MDSVSIKFWLIMKATLKRICIYPKDIQLITGKSYRQSARLAQKIKKELNKTEKDFLTVEEFCNYTGIPFEQIDHLILG